MNEFKEDQEKEDLLERADRIFDDMVNQKSDEDDINYADLIIEIIEAIGGPILYDYYFDKMENLANQGLLLEEH